MVANYLSFLLFTRKSNQIGVSRLGNFSALSKEMMLRNLLTSSPLHAANRPGCCWMLTLDLADTRRLTNQCYGILLKKLLLNNNLVNFSITAIIMKMIIFNKVDDFPGCPIRSDNGWYPSPRLVLWYWGGRLAYTNKRINIVHFPFIPK